ncbi:MAG: Na/Pi symporter [Nanoarchaeota archaeon]|nr:Na/Pi symporter [Nanoarchaeota archaeon]
MENWITFTTVLISAIILFLFGIEHFSREIQRVAGERFKRSLSKITNNKWSGAFLGFSTTALAQSSTAITVILVSLVNSGVIKFTQSLGIIIGSNVGTTLTGQLIAFKLTAFAPIFIIAGFIVSLIGGKYKVIGKPLFYFGLVFFSLELISDIVSPLSNDPNIIKIISYSSNVFIAVLAGAVLTLILQSSAVTTGLVIVFTASGLISLDQGIPLLLGANIGTTATALIAATMMNKEAKKTALAHFLFNLLGVLIILPFLGPFTDLVSQFGQTEANKLANAHTIFNVAIAIIFLLALTPFRKLVEYLGDKLYKNNQKKRNRLP